MSTRWLVWCPSMFLIAPAALAGPSAILSEPGSLELLGLAGVVAVVAAIRKRRK